MIQFLGPIANLAGTWLEGKVEEKKAVTGAKVAKAQAEAVIMQKKATGEIDWDLKMADFVLDSAYTLILWRLGQGDSNKWFYRS